MHSIRFLLISVALIATSFRLSAFDYIDGAYVYRTTSGQYVMPMPAISRTNAAIDASSMTSSDKATLKSLFASTHTSSIMSSGQPRRTPTGTFTASSGSLSVMIENTREAEDLNPPPADYNGMLHIVTFIVSGPDAPTNVAPSATISAPSGTVRAADTTSWPLSASDTNGNLSGYRVYLDGATAPGWTSISGASFSGSYSFTPTTAGTYTFRIDVRDSNGATATSTATKTVDPRLVYRSLTVNRNPSNMGSVSGAGTYLDGSTATVSATIPVGYSLSWSGDASGSSNPTSVLMTLSEKTVTANFTPISYTLTTAMNGNGSVTAGGTQAYGTTKSITASPATGYTFTGWSGATTGTTNPVSITFDANKTLTANFSVNSYTLTTSTNGSGSVTAGGTQAYGTTKSITATPATGYTFTGWSGAASGTTNPVSITFDANKTLTANFSVNSYTLTTAKNGGGLVTAGGTQAYGTTKLITASPWTGYSFTGWSGAASGTTNPVSITFDANKTLTADFSPNNNTVTLNKSPASGGTVTGAGTYATGEDVAISAMAAPGYSFAYWRFDWNSFQYGTASFITSVNQNRSYTAVFTPNDYTLTTTVSGSGSVTAGGTQAYGTTKSITATPATGYTFTGWSGAASGTTNPVSITFDGDKTLTANFSVNSYTLTTSTNGSGSVTAGGTQAYGTTKSITATPATGYTFTGWSGAASGTTNPVTITFNANKSLTANFTPNNYTLITSAGTGGSVTPGGTQAYGTTKQITATASTGYTFSGWSGTNTGSTNPLTITFNGDKTLTANFTPNDYTVSTAANPSAGGSVSGGGVYAYGTSATLTATPSSSYNFTGWSGSATGSTNPMSLTVNAPKSITANFTLKTYVLSSNSSPAAGGSVSGAGTFSHGSNATLTANPSTGYEFTGWSGDASGSTNPLTVNMTSTKSITANFALTSHTVTTTANPAAGGSVSGGGTFSYGSSTSLSATPATGYNFTGWSGDASGPVNPYALTINTDKSVTANFTLKTYALTTTASPAAGGSITGGGSYSHGVNATVTATPTAGYSFAGWSGDASGSTNPLTVNMTSAKSITAVFSLIPPPTATISASASSGWTPLSSTLTWSSSNASTVSVSGPSFSSSTPSGSQPLTLTGVGTYTYTITATNANGSATDSVTITVAPATYTLTTSASGNGSITAGGVYPKPNPTVTAVTLTASPAPTARFSGWSGDTTGTVSTAQPNGSATLYVPMTQDRSIQAAFIAKLSQTIAFPNPGTRSMKNGPFPVSATASSGLPVTFVVTSGPATIAGNMVTLTGEGNVTVTAYQSGDNTYLAANPVSQSFTAINPAVTTFREEQEDTSVNDGNSEERNFGDTH